MIFPPVAAMRAGSGRWVLFRSSVKWVLGKPWRRSLYRVLCKDEHMARLVRARPIVLRPLLRAYLDRRTPLWTRQIQFAEDLSFAGERLPCATKAALAADGWITIAKLADGFSVSFGVNDICPEEGIWALCIRDALDRRVFQLTFGLLPGHRIMVGSVQGGRQEADFEPAAAIRAVTKLCHGIRPQMLLAEILTGISRVWACRSVEFVPPRYQARSRWHRASRGIQFDYRAYFQECGMTRQENTVWRLPGHLPRKRLDEVESRKRSMYRKRFAFLDAILNECVAELAK